MRRCHFCPSTELRAQRFHPVDLLLWPIAVRRRRCLFCEAHQWHWLIPRFVRWGLALVLILALYIASPGPVDWLEARGNITPLTHERLNELVYAPLHSVLNRSKAENCKVTAAYWKYRDWWVPPEAGNAAAAIRQAPPLPEVGDDANDADSEATTRQRRQTIETVDRHFAADDRQQ